MCGIAGEIGGVAGYSRDRIPDYGKMQEKLSRRGPDQSGIYITDGAALIHTRLAVIDVENGRQPMVFDEPSGRHILVYNGELYNYQELRRELVLAGHSFRTNSDTEVVGRAFLEWGERCVDYFNGIFAFCIYSESKKSAFLARDPIGVKPLFYSETKAGTLVFASELGSLTEHTAVPRILGGQGIAEILFLGPGRTPGCGVFEGVHELLPGERAVFSDGKLKRERYWHLRDRENSDSYGEAKEKVRYLVRDAIRRQTVSDVPLGAFLSGGLDSSIITAVMATEGANSGDFKTFSVGYRDNEKYFQASRFQPNSDDYYIDLMNGAFGTESVRVTLDTEELVAALYEAQEARGLPGMADVDSSLLLFCREIKKHVTVGLSGECADEIFGGYPWYRDKQIRDRDGFPWAQTTAYRKSFALPLEGFDADEYIGSRYRQTLQDSDILPGLSPDERRQREMVNLNFMWFMQTLLDRKDRMSMYSGLEVRVPFCDKRIAEYLYTLPWEYKDKNGREKGLLREAAEELLPEEVVHRKKSPYPKTHNPAFLAAVCREMEGLLADKGAPLWQLVSKDTVGKLTRGEDMGFDYNATPWYGQLMTRPQTIGYFLQVNEFLKTVSLV
ncbi:MAG: asparagine synthase (glutamine-hydrolyzing) [Oscillospiraceae bacterium]|jgi:asparagine synthase (glutamine-hydrolysing)|nr:asparagine synthase (glutamine-hydrolyzing) [Oscillospiraceae bacterium]